MTIAGTEYVTTAEAARRLGALRTPVDRLHDWKRRGLIDVLRDVAGRPVRVDGRQLMWPWPAVAEVERATRRSPAGARRAA